MRLRLIVFGTVGAAATAVAATMLLVPGFGAGLVETVGSLDPTIALVVGSFAIGCCGLLAAWLTGGISQTDRTPYDTAVENPPEAVTAVDSELVGADVDAAVEEALAGDDDAMNAVVSRLRGTATAVYATANGVSQSAAADAIAAGTWTDDRVATALLAARTPQPLLARLRLWLDPESERERRIRRTVDEIERLAGGGQ